MFYYYSRGYPYFAVMAVSIDQWCVGIGVFYGKVYVSIKVFNTNICLSSVCKSLFSLIYCSYLFLFLLLLCNRDVESNPGPKKNKEFSISCCHWNVNSLLAHDCAKVTSLEAYNSVFNVKRESVKDYKYFFYQYLEFHVFTRQSSVENCYQRTNYNIMVSNKNDVNPGGHPGPRHTCRTKPSCKNI